MVMNSFGSEHDRQVGSGNVDAARDSGDDAKARGARGQLSASVDESISLMHIPVVKDFRPEIRKLFGDLGLRIPVSKLPVLADSLAQILVSQIVEARKQSPGEASFTVVACPRSIASQKIANRATLSRKTSTTRSDKRAPWPFDKRKAEDLDLNAVAFARKYFGHRIDAQVIPNMEALGKLDRGLARAIKKFRENHNVSAVDMVEKHKMPPSRTYRMECIKNKIEAGQPLTPDEVRSWAQAELYRNQP